VVLVLSLSAATLTCQPPLTTLKLSVVFKHGTESTVSHQDVLGTYGWRQTIRQCNWNYTTYNKLVNNSRHLPSTRTESSCISQDNIQI